jgi:demethylmenaquinone methyltransferase/2-methoxy-6-polyprenyl-1,4-benzoquinol methylase
MAPSSLSSPSPGRGSAPIYSFHLRHIVPRVAGLLTGDRGAYQYLGDSIGAFPGAATRSPQEILAAGFSTVSVSRMTMGIVALHVARR